MGYGKLVGLSVMESWSERLSEQWEGVCKLKTPALLPCLKGKSFPVSMLQSQDV